jgi:DNA-binding NtrC family response regulator
MGAFEYADGGTLFLDEIGDMPLATQTKLLRVLEEQQITRVGDHKPQKVNVRVISATNRLLEEAVANKEFRNDLYYRLNVVTIELPALRERRDDIVPLVDHFRKQFCDRHAKQVESISAEVMRKLYAHAWPGNIRQLRNTIESMVVLDTDGVLNVLPKLEVKMHILRNAVNFANKIGIARPKVSVLSATEEILKSVPSSIEAQTITKRAKEENINADIFGPLAFDNSVSKKAAAIKKIKNEVAGSANILLVPNVETGNALVKMMIYFMEIVD